MDEQSLEQQVKKLKIETEFERELASLLNKYSQENESNTPDFILARYLNGCLRLFNATVNTRSDWYGRHDVPGGNRFVSPDGHIASS